MERFRIFTLRKRGIEEVIDLQKNFVTIDSDGTASTDQHKDKAEDRVGVLRKNEV